MFYIAIFKLAYCDASHNSQMHKTRQKRDWVILWKVQFRQIFFVKTGSSSLTACSLIASAWVLFRLLGL